MVFNWSCQLLVCLLVCEQQCWVWVWLLHIYSAFPSGAVEYYKGIAILSCTCSNIYLKDKNKNAGHLSCFCDCNLESLLSFEVMSSFLGYFHTHLLFKSVFSSFWFRLFLWSRWSLNLLLPAYFYRLRSCHCTGQLRVLRLFYFWLYPHFLTDKTIV